MMMTNEKTHLIGLYTKTYVVRDKSFDFEFRRRSSAKVSDEPTLDIIQALKECDQINKLFLQNHLNEALRKAKAKYILQYTCQHLLACVSFSIENIVRSITAYAIAQLLILKP